MKCSIVLCERDAEPNEWGMYALVPGVGEIEVRVKFCAECLKLLRMKDSSYEGKNIYEA